MKELRCPNCSSFEIDYVNGIFVCRSCGGKYIPDENEKPRKSEEDKLAEKLVKKLKKRDRYDDLGEDGINKWLECTDDIDMIIADILEINSLNSYAWAVRMLRNIEDGLKSPFQAEKVVAAAENALGYAQDKDIKNIIDVVDLNFSVYKDRLVELNPNLEKRAEALEALVKQKREIMRGMEMK